MLVQLVELRQDPLHSRCVHTAASMAGSLCTVPAWQVWMWSRQAYRHGAVFAQSVGTEGSAVVACWQLWHDCTVCTFAQYSMYIIFLYARRGGKRGAGKETVGRLSRNAFAAGQFLNGEAQLASVYKQLLSYSCAYLVQTGKRGKASPSHESVNDKDVSGGSYCVKAMAKSGLHKQLVRKSCQRRKMEEQSTSWMYRYNEPRGCVRSGMLGNWLQHCLLQVGTIHLAEIFRWLAPCKHACVACLPATPVKEVYCKVVQACMRDLLSCNNSERNLQHWCASTHSYCVCL